MNKKNLTKVGLITAMVVVSVIAGSLVYTVGLYVGFYLGGAKILIGFSTLPTGAYLVMQGITQFVLCIAFGVVIFCVGLISVEALDEKRVKYLAKK